jgi:c-di-GMP-binding flagellar brake protein YcgR
MSEEEKRRYIRFNMFLDAFLRTKGSNKKTRIKDFSREGMGIASEDFISSGEEVELEFTIPGDNIPIVVTGQIAWTSGQEEERSSEYRSGVLLDKISNSDRGKILDFIYKKWMTGKS